MPLTISCSNEEKVPVTATPTTATGKPARFDGALRVTVQSGDGTVEQDPAKPNDFFAVSGVDPGVTEYLVEGDADLGEGVVLIQDTVTLTATGANAANFGLVAAAAVPK
jgi:hypothetical protein